MNRRDELCSSGNLRQCKVFTRMNTTNYAYNAAERMGVEIRRHEKLESLLFHNNRRRYKNIGDCESQKNDVKSEKSPL